MHPTHKGLRLAATLLATLAATPLSDAAPAGAPLVVYDFAEAKGDIIRELSGVFHAITSAGGRFKTGQILDVNAEGIDVYNTMVSAVGAKEQLDSAKRESKRVDEILA